MQKILLDFENSQELWKGQNWLTEQYWGFDLSIREMEKLAGLSPNHGASITYWMDKYRIPRKINPKSRKDGVRYDLLDDINWLTEQHWGFDLTIKDMAKIIGVQGNKVATRLKKFGIPIHSIRNPKSELQIIEDYHYPEWLIEQHYDKNLSTEKMAEIAGCCADNIAKFMHGYEFPVNMQIEHTFRDEKGRRWCYNCKQWLDVKEFYKTKSTTDCLQPECKECGREKSLELRWENRIVALQIYSDGYMKCELCGIDDIDVLSIDHIGGGGYKHVKENNIKGQFVRWLKRNDYPDGFRILCHNCNHKERMNAYNKDGNWEWTRGKDQQLEIKIIILQIYSKGTMKCSLCDEDNVDCLAVDHIGGGGTKHFKEIGNGQLKKGKGIFYGWLIKNNFPEGFRILCHNCNHGEKLRLHSS